MKQYYVKFTYNGQYYQPTTYSDTSSWGTNSWEKNSNGADTRSERIAFKNVVFDDLTLFDFEVGQLGSVEMPFTYEDYDLLDLI